MSGESDLAASPTLTITDFVLQGSMQQKHRVWSHILYLTCHSPVSLFAADTQAWAPVGDTVAYQAEFHHCVLTVIIVNK